MSTVSGGLAAGAPPALGVGVVAGHGVVRLSRITSTNLTRCPNGSRSGRDAGVKKVDHRWWPRCPAAFFRACRPWLKPAAWLWPPIHSTVSTAPRFNPRCSSRCRV